MINNLPKVKRGSAAKVCGATVILALIGVIAAGCGGTSQSANKVPTIAGNAPWMTVISANSGSGQGKVVNVSIGDQSTPEGSEPAYVGSSGKGTADLFTVKVGQEVQVVVENKDAMPHTFTVAQLGLNVTVAPEATTKLSFVAKTAGTYSWYCAIPCGSWVMSHAGYMKGYFKVI